MVAVRDESVFKRAQAWHDHGHDNNPDRPRWEDSRSSSGFNFRMSELQGAVGLAQLRKLPNLVERQRGYHRALWDPLSPIPGLKLRAEPAESYATHDALVFHTPSRELAARCRRELVLEGLGTKILPEATTWHFARHWDHMPELENFHGNLQSAFKRSEETLQSCVSLPVSANLEYQLQSRIADAVSRAIGHQ